MCLFLSIFMNSLMFCNSKNKLFEFFSFISFFWRPCTWFFLLELIMNCSLTHFFKLFFIIFIKNDTILLFQKSNSLLVLCTRRRCSVEMRWYLWKPVFVFFHAFQTFSRRSHLHTLCTTYFTSSLWLLKQTDSRKCKRGRKCVVGFCWRFLCKIK